MKIRVMIVDDSAFMRVTLQKIIESEEITVCATARDGQDALNKIPLFKPDVVTLDYEMPVMNGIECLKQIMSMPKKIPAIMFSSHTTDGAKLTLEAMNLGAVDFITKPSKSDLDDFEKLRSSISEKIKVAANINVSKLAEIRAKLDARANQKSEFVKPESERPPVSAPSLKIQSVENSAARQAVSKKLLKTDICIIGTSTGGPPALQNVLEKIPEDFPCGIIIVQHMPKGFTKSLAERLNSLCKIGVKESEDGDIIKPGLAIIAQAGYQLDFAKRGNDITIKHRMPKSDDLFKPAVNDMFFAAGNFYDKKNILAVILTGMGNDGLIAIRDLYKNGSYIIAESEESAVVFGMPGVVVKDKVCDKILPIWEIGAAITQLAMKR